MKGCGSAFKEIGWSIHFLYSITPVFRPRFVISYLSSKFRKTRKVRRSASILRSQSRYLVGEIGTLSVSSSSLGSLYQLVVYDSPNLLQTFIDIGSACGCPVLVLIIISMPRPCTTFLMFHSLLEHAQSGYSEIYMDRIWIDGTLRRTKSSTEQSAFPTHIETASRCVLLNAPHISESSRTLVRFLRLLQSCV
ncbi:hypothetical protein B0J11DRAFT_216382 [Dendryphion nanum]|uniref:Uncharacterized protein n=1 Tax=Dendryphion nanum TaxID=256645 RepID=A0A9P9E7K4_9PLEO|nr:hypothetical protein B0J11DRAFT_216382 [Dendryphion nanum]